VSNNGTNIAITEILAGRRQIREFLLGAPVDSLRLRSLTAGNGITAEELASAMIVAKSRLGDGFPVLGASFVTSDELKSCSGPEGAEQLAVAILAKSSFRDSLE
jgi:hypothetical protein